MVINIVPVIGKRNKNMNAKKEGISSLEIINSTCHLSGVMARMETCLE
jgi:hypothetical protein